MSNNDKTKGGCCCTSPTPGLRMLTFPDGIRLAVFGLDKIFAAVYDEGREVNTDTAAEIVKRLAVNNYIASSARQKGMAVNDQEVLSQKCLALFNPWTNQMILLY